MPPSQPPHDREVELKLAIAPESADHLLELPALRALVSEPASRRQLRSIYYDTRDLDLHRGGFSLRVRAADGRWTQTLKSTGGGAAGLFDRPELEWPLAGPEPVLALLGAAGVPWAEDAMMACADRPLEPVIETVFQRTTLPLRSGDSDVELAIDVGHVQARGERLPISEIELELRSGSVAALYDVALALCEQAALQPSVDSKFARGFALLSGERRAARRAAPLEFDEDTALEDVISAVIDDCVQQIVDNREAAMAGDDPESIHQLRVGARRLRSALSLFKAVLPGQPTGELRDELRWMGGELGAARDLDVLLQERLEPLLARHPDDGGLKRLVDEARAARAEAYGRARAALDSPRFAKAVLRIGWFLATRDWRNQPLTPDTARLFAPARPTAVRLLRKRHKRALAAGGELARMSVEELHALRIELKKLRYATEFLRGLFPEKSSATTSKGLRRLQTLLGRMNDDEAAARLIDQLLARMGVEAGPAQHRAAGFAIGWAAQARAVAFEHLDRSFERFAKARPFWR